MTIGETNHAWITVTNGTRPKRCNCRRLWKKWQTLQHDAKYKHNYSKFIIMNNMLNCKQ